MSLQTGSPGLGWNVCPNVQSDEIQGLVNQNIGASSRKEIGNIKVLVIFGSIIHACFAAGLSKFYLITLMALLANEGFICSFPCLAGKMNEINMFYLSTSRCYAGHRPHKE